MPRSRLNLCKSLPGVLAALLIFCGGTLQAGAANTHGLASVEWLAAKLDSPKLVLLDASQTFNYIDAHIPGARSVSFPEALSVSGNTTVSYGGGIDFISDSGAPYPFQDLPREPMEKIFRSWGINDDSIVVVYDHGETMLASRLFYSLYYWGVKNVYILDGGFYKWREKNLPVSTEIPPAPVPGTVTIGTGKSEILADTQEVLNASGSPDKVQIFSFLNSRSLYKQPMYNRLGRIPHTMNTPEEMFLNKDKTFKSPEEIKRIFAFFGASPDKPTITYCGGNVAGSTGFFILKFLAGYSNVKLYGGSLLAWEHDERILPLWAYDQVYKMRDNGWIAWWNGARTRSLGNIHTSLIDIRSESEYAAGHLPFALNIPYRVFKETLGDWERLAARLEVGGVNQGHEAIVYGNGLTRESALAAWTLEYLGQRAVSVGIESLRDWENQGHRPVKTPPELGKKRVPFDLIIEPSPYKPSLRSALRADLKKVPDFPRIFIASGPVPPKNTPPGEMMHIHSARALKPEGGLLDAGALYTLFSENYKIPKLAEIVCVADDPADAALNWFAMKQLGYPNVTVLLP